MSSPKASMAAPAPRLALTLEEAAACLSVSADFFREHVQPEIRIVREGRRRIVPMSELQRWLEANAESMAEELRDA